MAHRRVRRAEARLALQPMGASRLTRVERVRLAARYIPTCGGLAARLRHSELPRAPRALTLTPMYPSSSGRPVSLPSPTLPPPLLPSPPPPSLPQAELRWPSSSPLPLALLLLPPPPCRPQATLALTLAPQPSPR